MKQAVLILALTAAVGATAEEWVSVGAGGTVAAPAETTNYVDTSQQAQLSSPQDDGGNTLLSELAAQVEQMQQEIALLRGQLEQQEFQFKQLEKEQQQRYLDVDRRLSALLVSEKPVVASATQPTKTQDDAADKLYQEAMSLVKAKEFNQAQAKFAQLLKEHPDDPLVANALYWSAEVWLVEAEPEKALVEFKKVVKGYPDHTKSADSAYKIGVTLDRQGKSEEAKQWLQKVIDDYQGKSDSTVRLAQSYLDKM